ncbi:PREDICTED: polyadenylate-binding protein 2-like [Amphimedon queenslandica]|nr:PREDICTED: polyadenylate-binding protein 2-like [Amphimedon queenslandica]|eukprot:XP_003384742.1 PREDICTED: polyadenylate-binding protein 2-like [Amphimedon queenslandica]
MAEEQQQQRNPSTSLSISEDLLEEGSTPRGTEPDDSALLDSALGVGEEEEDEDGSLRDPDGDLDGEISLLDQEDAKETIPIEDPEIEAIKARVKEMEEEAEKLKEMQGEVEKELMGSKPAQTNNFPTMEEKLESDSRSVYVGNVDYQATAEELGQHFNGCGSINRVTILCDKYSGHPKGFAYVEFIESDSVKMALDLDESLFRGRQIKVTAKRTNRPGLAVTNRGRRGRGRGMRGGMMMGFNPYMGGYIPMMPFRGRGRGFRGRAKTNWYAPY